MKQQKKRLPSYGFVGWLMDSASITGQEGGGVKEKGAGQGTDYVANRMPLRHVPLRTFATKQTERTTMFSFENKNGSFSSHFFFNF